MRIITLLPDRNTGNDDAIWVPHDLTGVPPPVCLHLSLQSGFVLDTCIVRGAILPPAAMTPNLPLCCRWSQWRTLVHPRPRHRSYKAGYCDRSQHKGYVVEHRLYKILFINLPNENERSDDHHIHLFGLPLYPRIFCPFARLICFRHQEDAAQGRFFLSMGWNDKVQSY